MNFVKLTGAVLLFAVSSAYACPTHCLCDKDGKIVSDHRYLSKVNSKTLNQLSQDQTEAQNQSQSSVNTNSNTSKSESSSVSTATGGNATATGGTATASASAAGAGANNGNGSNNTTINDNSPKIPVATALGLAPPPTAPCMGSFGVGGQTAPIGLSFGSTKVDNECVLEHQVFMLQEMGLNEAACYRARAGKEGEAIDAAMTKAGIDCKSFAKTAPAPADVVTKEELNRAVTHALQK